MEEKINPLKIQTLSSFSVTRGDEDLTQKNRLSKKPWLLLKFLISNRGRISSKERLTQILGSDEYYGDPDSLITNLVYRLRKILEERSDDNNFASSILFENNGYRWNKTKCNLLDLDIIDDLYIKISSRNYSEKERMKFCDEIISLYKFDYLPENDQDDWASRTRMHYRNIFIKTVMEKINYLSFNSQYEDIISICENTFVIDYYNVDIHVEYLKALLQMNNIRSALTHYEEATQKLYIQAGISPSPAMMGIYKTIKQNQHMPVSSFSDINITLVQQMQTAGALVCDSNTFRFIYNLEKNKEIRHDESVYLLLLSFVHKDGTITDENLLKKEMKKLEEALKKTLRNTDVISKWSRSQYLLLLYRMESENMDIVLKRIDQGYSFSDCTFNIITSFKRI